MARIRGINWQSFVLSEAFFCIKKKVFEVMVQIRRKGPKRSERVGMQKGANFTIVSTMVLIGLNIKFYEIFAKQHVY